jgi:glycosyltransferase involved in cell wall biosynthesis
VSVHASVVIPTHNRKRLLEKVLAAYRRQDRPSTDFELVVVDDGSEDGTASLFTELHRGEAENNGPMDKQHEARIVELRAGRYGRAVRSRTGKGNTGRGRRTPGEAAAINVRYVRIVKSGRSIARNIGIRFSSGPLIIFADDDIFVETSFIRKHIESHSPADRTVVMGRVIHTATVDNPQNARWKPKDINTAFLATGNASVLKEHLLRAGLFDEGYSVSGWEDFDLGIHLQEMGLRSIRRKIYGYHYDPPVRWVSPREVYEKERERGFSAVYFFTNHPLRWVGRFTLVDNRILQALVRLLGRGNWFLSRERLYRFRKIARLIIRYKGYFDGVAEGKRVFRSPHARVRTEEGGKR